MEVAQIIAHARQFGADWVSRFRFRERRDPSQDRWIFTAPDGTERAITPFEMPAIAKALGGWPRDPSYMEAAA